MLEAVEKAQLEKWVQDQERRQEAGVWKPMEFMSKPQRARQTLHRALDGCCRVAV